MNSINREVYEYTHMGAPDRPWWRFFAEGVAGRSPVLDLDALRRQRQLEARIAGRRAAASGRMKAIRTASERSIARMIRASFL